MPRQHELPHTASPSGPCDHQRDAYADALELAAEAAADKKRARDALVDKMLLTGTGRVPFVDAKGKRRWLVITAGEPKLKSEKAEAGEAQVDESATDRKRRSQAVKADGPPQSERDGFGQQIGESAEAGGGLSDVDPFAGTRSEMATDDANVEDRGAGGRVGDSDEETPAQTATREAETARAGRRKRGGR